MIIEVFINDLNVRKTRDDCLFNLREVFKRHGMNPQLEEVSLHGNLRNCIRRMISK